jgi:hypothetical protein
MGLTPVISRVEGSPMVKILRYNTDEPPIMSVEGDAVMIKSSTCIAPEGTDAPGGSTDAPGGSTDAPTEGGDIDASADADSSSLRTGSVATSMTMLVGSYLLGASPPVAVGLSALTAMSFNAPMVTGQSAANGDCEQTVEIEVRGPVPDTDTDELLAEVESLRSENSGLMDMLNMSVSLEEAEMMQIDVMVENFAKQDFISASLPVDQSVDKLGKFGNSTVCILWVNLNLAATSNILQPTNICFTLHTDNNGRAQIYDVAGFPIYNSHSPEASFHLSNAGDDSLVRDMQGDVFQFPTDSNEVRDWSTVVWKYLCFVFHLAYFLKRHVSSLLLLTTNYLQPQDVNL